MGEESIGCIRGAKQDQVETTPRQVDAARGITGT